MLAIFGYIPFQFDSVLVIISQHFRFIPLDESSDGSALQKVMIEQTEID